MKSFIEPSASDLQRLRSRAAALQQLNHPGLAKPREAIENADTFALAYDWVEGETIAEMIERGRRFTDAELLQCLRDVLDALDYAHQQDPPVIHRDIKPQNIVWTGERFVVIDFDAARDVLAGDGSASVVGTTGYAAPEQFVGAAEPRSDQYGLASTVLHMATHRHPTEFPLAGLRIDMSRADLSTPIRRLLDRMLQPQVDARFADSATALDAAETAAGIEPWRVPLEALDDLRSSLSADVEEERLTFRFDSRTRPEAFTRAAVALALCVAGMLFCYIAPVFADGSSDAYLMFSLFLQYSVYVWFLLIPYFGSRLLQEYRGRKPATLSVGAYDWWLEVGNGAPVQESGEADVRLVGRSGAQSVAGITPVSIRNALTVWDSQGATARRSDFEP